MELRLNIFKEYGIGGLILVVSIYIILKGQFTFHYPRSKDLDKKEKNSE